MKRKNLFICLTAVLLIALSAGIFAISSSAVATVSYDGQTIDISSCPSSTFVVLKRLANETKYTLVGGYNDLTSTDSATGAIQAAKGAICKNGTDDMSPSDRAVILMRKNYTNTQGYNNTSMIGGTVVIDLMGNTLTTTAPIFNAQAKYSYGDGYFEIRNGFITQSSALVNLSIKTDSGAASDYERYGGKDKHFDFYFYNLRITYASGATNTEVIAKATSSENGNITAKVTLDSCYIDLVTNVPKGSGSAPKLINIVSFKDTGYRIDGTLSIKGAKLKLATNEPFDCYAFPRDNGNGDSVIYEKNESGAYLDLSFPYRAASDYPADFSTSFKSATNGKTLTFGITYNRSSNENVYYTLGENESTKYGTIPRRYAYPTAFPYTVFSDGKFVGAYSTMTAALDAVSNEYKTNGATATTLLLRRNATVSSPYSNTSYIKGNLNIDLGGFSVISSASGGFLNLQAKNTGTQSINIFGGQVFLSSGGIACMSAYSQAADSGYSLATDTSYKTFNVSFKDVRFSFAKGNTVTNMTGSFQDGIFAGSGNKRSVTNFKFTDCTFDLTHAKSGTTIFNANDTVTQNTDKTAVNSSVNIRLTSCKIISERALTSYTLYSVNQNNGSSVIIETGTRLLQKKSLAAPSLTLPTEKGSGAFMSAGEDGGLSAYTLADSKTAKIAFTPSSSITLHSDIIFNVYLPENSYMTGAVLDGVAVNRNTVKNGCYTASVSLPAKEAARTLTLVANFTVDGTPVSLTFDFSVLSYAERLLSEGGISEKERALARDILAYIASAYEYFNSDGKEEVSRRVEDILGDRTSGEFQRVTGASSDIGSLIGSTLILDATPRVRFYFASRAERDAHTFRSEGTQISAEVGGEPINGTTVYYSDITLYAHRMIKAVELYRGGVSVGTYHINSYVDYVKNTYSGANKTALVSLVERFYVYCKSADTYKALTTSPIPHTHSYTVKEQEPTYLERGYKLSTCACGEEIKEYTTGLSEDKNLNILFVGNSHTDNNNLPSVFSDICASAGYSYTVKKSTAGGYWLLKFANYSDTNGKAAQDAINNNGYDFVFLQGSAPYAVTQPETIYDGIRKMGKIVEDSGAVPIIYQPFSRKQPHATLTDAGISSEEMTFIMTGVYDAIAKETGYVKSPGGIGVYNIYKNYPSIEVYAEDHNHPSALGTYVSALCHFATLTGRSPIGVPYTFGLDPATARIVQTAAHDAVFNPLKIPDKYKTTSEGKGEGATSVFLTQIPAGSTLISSGIKGSSGKTHSTESGAALTATQKKDIADIKYGLSVIGISSAPNGVGVINDGKWKNDAAYRTSSNFIGDTHFIDGTVNSIEQFKCLVTFNFGKQVNMTALAFFANTTAGMPQAIEIFTSNDGATWSIVPGACYDTSSGSVITTAASVPSGSDGNTTGAMAIVDLKSASGGITAQYIRIGIIDGVTASNKTYDLNVQEIAVYGKTN
ncbi:MAG: hypothetical protein J6L90_06965 [Clostridia bacterium]|nr:hypothetical protein [Clostridia bacterium]